jgi:hypothetical protein
LLTAGLGTLYIIVEGWGSALGEYDLHVEANYLGLSEQSDGVLIYPNPTNGMVRISNFTGKLLVKNTLGQVQKESFCSKEMELNLNDLSSGTYFLCDESGRILDKIIIIKND